jgi:signal transduction histidine kinase
MTLLWKLRLRIGIVALAVLTLGGLFSLVTMQYLLSQVKEQKEQVISGPTKQVLEDTYEKIIKLEVTQDPEYAKEEEFVRGVARDAATDVARVLTEKYQDPNPISDEVLINDKDLHAAALRWVERQPPAGIPIEDADDRRLGYTALYARGEGIMLQHAQERLIGQKMAQKSRKAELLNWWKIYGGAMDGQETEGYYLWTEADGTQSVKFMVCTPIKGTRFIIAATKYTPPELTKKVLATVKVFKQFEGHIERRLGSNIEIGFIVALAISLTAALIIHLLVDLELRRIAHDQQQIERYWKIAKTTDLASTLWHDLKNDCFLISLTIHQTLRFMRTRKFSLDSQLEERLKNIMKRVARLESQAKYFERKDARAPKLVNITNVIESIVAQQQGQTDVPIQMVTADASRHLTVPGEEMDLRILFNNIVRNAIQACGPNGRVRIDLVLGRRHWRRYVRAIIRDSGPGFSSINLATEPGHSDGREGRTGMGLPIAERTILEHRGFLELRNSRHRDWGAEVIVGLPYDRTRSLFIFRWWAKLQSDHV